MARVEGFEPPTAWFVARCLSSSNRLLLIDKRRPSRPINLDQVARKVEKPRAVFPGFWTPAVQKQITDAVETGGRIATLSPFPDSMQGRGATVRLA